MTLKRSTIATHFCMIGLLSLIFSPFVQAKTTVISSRLDRALKGPSSSHFIDKKLFHKHDKDLLQLRLTLSKVTSQRLEQIENAGAQVERVLTRFNRVQVWIAKQNVDNLKSLPFIQKIQWPRFGQSNLEITRDPIVPRTPLTQSQGFDILGIGNIFSHYDVKGHGIRIGVISDGVAGLTGSVSSHDLPGILFPSSMTSSRHDCDDYGSIVVRAGVTCKSFNSYGIDKNDTGNSAAEGTAMLEILHEIAPEAQLFFANFRTEDDFIAAMDWLALPESLGGAGVDIIVDDITWYTQPYFEDGEVAQVAQDISDQGILFVSAAGNGADNHAQSEFTDQDNDAIHEFPHTSNGTYTFGIPSGGTTYVILQWNDDHNNPVNDLDLHVTLDTGITHSSRDSASDQVAMEVLSVTNPNTSLLYGTIEIEKVYDNGEPIEIEIFTVGSAYDSVSVRADSIVGHAAAEGVITVAATAYTNTRDLRPFSAQGPVTLKDQERDKPNVTSVDGVSVTGNGGFNNTFTGTSAAAPHIAGCLALIKSAAPDLEANDIKTILYASTNDIQEEGFDSLSGHGVVDCYLAIENTYLFLENPEQFISIDENSEDESESETEKEDIGLPDDLQGTNVDAPDPSDISDFSIFENKPISGTPLTPASSGDGGGCALQTSQQTKPHTLVFFLFFLLFLLVLRTRNTDKTTF